jgi:hypothetical protein
MLPWVAAAPATGLALENEPELAAAPDSEPAKAYVSANAGAAKRAAARMRIYFTSVSPDGNFEMAAEAATRGTA